jgi:hypothetical protein
MLKVLFIVVASWTACGELVVNPGLVAGEIAFTCLKLVKTTTDEII